PSDRSLGGGRGRSSGGAGGLDGADTSRSVPSLKFVVRWMSALPMREAVKRANGGTQNPAPDNAQPEYLIAVSGFPIELVRAGAEQLKARLKEATLLHTK